MKLYIAVLDEVPDHMVPVLVAHTLINAHITWYRGDTDYDNWLRLSFKKVVLRVNAKEFNKITSLERVFCGYENSTLNGVLSCAVVCPREEYPNVIKFAKMWQPKCS